MPRIDSESRKRKREKVNETVFVGIDPGKAGGLVYIQGDSICYTKMPDTERDIWNWFDSIPEPEFGCRDIVAVIEKVHAMPGQGVTSMFTFGRNFGFLRGCLIACGIPFEEAIPRAWQKGLDIPSKPKAAPKASHKLTLLSKAQELFPQMPLWKEPRSKGKQLSVCDALLIAEFNRRKSIASFLSTD